MSRLLLFFCLAGWLSCCRTAEADATGGAPFAPRVMIVSMFQAEAAPWLTTLPITHQFTVPGLPAEYSKVGCTDDGVCQVTTGMGHANAAASIAALSFNEQFDLRKTYFIVAGIAGIDPERGTIGSAAWARFAVDGGIAHEIDARELPKGWTDGYFGVLMSSPDQKPKLEYHSEVFRLNEALLQQALVLSKGVTLEDSDDVRAYRQHYQMPAARQAPRIIQCDTYTSDTWWLGPHLETHARHWTRLLTDDQGVYCTSQEEDNATMTALTLASQASRVDIQRVAIVRTGSDFDRAYPGQSSLISLQKQLAMTGAFKLSTDNLVRAVTPLMDAIVQHWPQWQDGVPAP
jgi:purine nucleoside permease